MLGVVHEDLKYKAFPVGILVRVADRASLDRFMASWLTIIDYDPEQHTYAG